MKIKYSFRISDCMTSPSRRLFAQAITAAGRIGIDRSTDRITTFDKDVANMARQLGITVRRQIIRKPMRTVAIPVWFAIFIFTTSMWSIISDLVHDGWSNQYWAVIAGAIAIDVIMTAGRDRA